MKGAFGLAEAVFNLLYLAAALTLASLLLFTASGSPLRMPAGVMGLVLAAGDAYHLVPRIMVSLRGGEEELRRALGRGKQVASVTMTLFYLLLWHIGVGLYAPKNFAEWSCLIYALAGIRIVLCLLPQNRWHERHSPLLWGVVRNIPFFLQGALVAGLFFMYRNSYPGFGLMWLAIALSFAFYLPVVLWANKSPKMGMLMLPKTCAYLWTLVIFLSL